MYQGGGEYLGGALSEEKGKGWGDGLCKEGSGRWGAECKQINREKVPLSSKSVFKDMGEN